MSKIVCSLKLITITFTAHSVISNRGSYLPIPVVHESAVPSNDGDESALNQPPPKHFTINLMGLLPKLVRNLRLLPSNLYKCSCKSKVIQIDIGSSKNATNVFKNI